MTAVDRQHLSGLEHEAFRNNESNRPEVLRGICLDEASSRARLEYLAEPEVGMRILVAMFQGGGNIPLILPIVGSLAGRGHQVRVLAGPGIRPAGMPIRSEFLQGIQAAGAVYVPLRAPAEAPYAGSPPLQGVIGRWLPSRLQRIAAGEARTTVWSGSWAENVTDAT